jgi:phosphohistidine phosphatase
MPTLVLMRHANAELATPGMRDFDRPLSAAGWKEAAIAAQSFSKTGIQIAKVFCSPARRTLETLECLRQTITISPSKIEHHPELYSGDMSSYRGLSEAADDGACLYIGHNPMIEHFAFELAAQGKQNDIEQLKTGFPTAAIAVFEVETDAAPIKPHSRLLHFLSPR